MADQYDQKTYPAVVSRTLDPSKKSLATIVALHDHEITDSDLNLIQDLQDLKRSEMLQDKSCVSGSLTYAPMQYNENIPNTFVIPTFDVLWNNVEIITIAGNLSSDLTVNRVQLPVPALWAPGTPDEDGRIYVVFLEIWYQALNPITGQGYYKDPITGLNYFYPYGGVNPDPSNAEIVPDDSVDPFQGLFTTERAQVQWRINVQRVSLNYNFSLYQFGLDPDTTDTAPYPALAPLSVYAQASQAAPVQAPIYQFTNMGTINGDTGLWRAGDGNVNNSLGTMDGYSYAMPLAVVFQKNTGNFDIASNIFGCASALVPNSGTLAVPVSGRFDERLADQIFPDNAVDTRATNTLDAWDKDELLGDGFGDLVQGKTTLVISRGLSPGNKVEDLGSTLPYYVSMTASPHGVPRNVGAFDGFMNGFSSDERTYQSTLQIPTNDKSSLGPGSTQGGSWKQGDSFTIALPTGSAGVITDVSVTALVSSISGAKAPAALLQGQISINGLGSGTVTVTLTSDLTGTLFDPGANNLYATVGVTYPAGTSVNLQQVPFTVDGGNLYDAQAGISMPVFGISEYAVQSQQLALTTSNLSNGYPMSIQAVWAINPEYSDIVLGTKIWVAIPGAAGIAQVVGGSPVTTFIIPCQNLNGEIGGLYCTFAWDFATGNFYVISSRTMSAAAGGIQTIVQIEGTVPASSTVVFSVIAQNTAQVAYNAPVKGVTQIEETVMFGNYSSSPSASISFPCDPRVVVESVSQPAGPGTPIAIVLGANGCQIKGISGNDTTGLIWVADNSGNLNALTITSLNFVNDVLVITVPGTTVTLTGINAQPFLFVGSILPALSSTSNLIMEIRYIPYQGEGVIGRNYEFLISEDNALVTSNGTGAAPIIGLTDVYPYNRELPIITMLPSQSGWNDATLTNTPLASFFDSNYVAMRADNVETVFLVPLHTNDFIPPYNKDTRKTIQFVTASTQRGFASATPHIGFGITALTPRTVLGQNLQNTVAPITLYVDNANGNDSNSGLTSTTAKATFASALAELPPVISFPCVVIFNPTGVPYNIATLAVAGSLEVVALGDGTIRSEKQYCLGNLSRVIQGEGRLVISQAPTATSPVIIDGTPTAAWSGFGDGPTAAFYIDTSRVLLNGIQFVGFTNPAVVAYNADIDMVNCSWVGNAQAGSYIGCDSVILDGGSTALPNTGSGHVCVQSNLTSSNHALTAIGSNPGVFYIGTRGSTLALQTHAAGSASQTDENWAVPSPTIVVAEAQLNTSIVVTSDFQTNGAAVVQANSTLSQTAVATPFLGGVTVDSSSSVVTQVG